MMERDYFPEGLCLLPRKWMELLIELDTIHKEQLPLIPVTEGWDVVFAGNVTYRTPRGWLLTVFNDCDSWDYLDNAVAPDGYDFREEIGGDNFYLDGCLGGTLYNPPKKELAVVWGRRGQQYE